MLKRGRYDQGSERREAGRDMGESYRERYRGHGREAGADYARLNRAGDESGQGRGTPLPSDGRSHFSSGTNRRERGPGGEPRYEPPTRGNHGAPHPDRTAEDVWRYAAPGPRELRGGMGEVGTSEGYARANDGEDYFYMASRGWGDQRAAYGNEARTAEGHAGLGPRGYARSDERIREDVCEALTESPHVDAREIEVRVEGSEVTLEGTVGTRQEKRAAEDAALAVRGVRDAHNRLRLRVDGAAPRSSATTTAESTPRVNGGRRDAS